MRSGNQPVTTSSSICILCIKYPMDCFNNTLSLLSTDINTNLVLDCQGEPLGYKDERKRFTNIRLIHCTVYAVRVIHLVRLDE